MKFAILFATALTALMVTFSLQNAQTVQVRFLAWYFEGPLVVVLLITFVVGALAIYLASLPRRFTRSRELADLRRQVDGYNLKIGRLQSDITGEGAPEK
jgi:uncharacterized integral membrane protein